MAEPPQSWNRQA